MDTQELHTAETKARLVAAVDFETFYDSKSGYSLTNLTPYEYVRDDRFNPYLVAVAYSDGRPTFVGNPRDYDWSLLDGALLLAHNAAFDGMVLMQMEDRGWVEKKPREWLCTADMVAFLGVSRNLKTACKELLGMEISKAVRTAMDGKTDLDLNDQELKDLIAYGGSDAEECLMLYQKFGDQWPQMEREISTQSRNAAWRGIKVNVEAVEEGIHTLSVVRDKSAAQLPWVAEGQKPGSLPALGAAVKALGLPVPPSFRKNDPRYLEWEAKYGAQCPFLEARVNYAGTAPHIARLQNLRDHLCEGDYHSDVKYFGTHCLTGAHEVMTRKGWVRFDAWEGGDIMQWNPETGCLAGFLPAKLFKAENTESEMIQVCTDNIRCIMTLGHTVPVVVVDNRKDSTFPHKTVPMKAVGFMRTVRRGEHLKVPFYRPETLELKKLGAFASELEPVTARSLKFIPAEKTVYCAETQTGFFVCRFQGTVFVSGNTGRTASGGTRSDGKESESASKINLLNLPKAPIHGVDMRGMFIPHDGHKFIIYDFGQIEARVIKWLAGDSSFVQMLKTEGNIYQAEAVKMNWVKPQGPSLKHTDKKLYQLAKAAVLGLGFGMSASKFVLSCRSMGLHLDPTPRDQWPDIESDRRLKFILANQLGIINPNEAWCEGELGVFFTADRIVQDWRRANPKVLALWHNLEEALRRSAIDGKDVHYFRLPSGRLKPYYRPRVRPEPKIFVDPDTGEKKTQVRNALTAAVIKDKPASFFHGGSLAENIVQATARDIMAYGAVDIEKLYPECRYMWSCYDEVIFEVPEDKAEEMNKAIPEVMCKGPSISKWIDDDLPLEVEGGIFDRYCK